MLKNVLLTRRVIEYTLSLGHGLIFNCGSAGHNMVRVVVVVAVLLLLLGTILKFLSFWQLEGAKIIW